MIKSYIDFSRRNWSLLIFGSLLMALSSFGQTYFVAMSGAHFREAFGLSDGGLEAAYAVGTFVSALTLTWAGRLIDYRRRRSLEPPGARLLRLQPGRLGAHPAGHAEEGRAVGIRAA